MKERSNSLPIWVYIVLVVLVIFFASRYGWRIFGFSQCGAGYSVEQVSVEEGKVTIKGMANSASAVGGFVGSTYEQEGNVLYVGLKYNVFLGVLPTDSSEFEYTFPTKGKVDTVVLRGNGKESVIWGSNLTDQMTVRVRVKGILMDELGFTCYYKDEAIASGGVTLSNENDFILPFVFYKSDFPEDADMSLFALGFELRGSEQTIRLEETIKPGIDWGEEVEILLEAAGEEQVKASIVK